MNFLAKVFEDSGNAALWWANLHPDKLSSFTDGSFDRLIWYRPKSDPNDIRTAVDDASVKIREFLSNVSDPDARAEVASLLEVVNGWMARERPGNASSDLPIQEKTDGPNPDAKINSNV
ncbi:hypothetical protein [Actinoplanes derwentensis]|uniref:hypothetical protein n=1 Tax=Actinoplanes derwentensis TaxID=113562 RepID=UPI0012FD0B44|nr:hypothetical protein [Actinoplanes derwentensis]